MAAFMINTTQNDENLEPYCLIWLDASVNNSQENLHAQQQLRSSIDHLLTFEDDHQCLQYIHLVPKDDRIVLIVSGSLGRIIVPKIVQLRQIISIYVYCMDKKANEQWAQHFSKVKGVQVRLDELIHQIEADQTQRQRHKTDEVSAINFFNSHVHDQERSSTGLNGQFIHSHVHEQERSTTELNGRFIHSQLLINCLIRMKSSWNERQELITFCKERYKNNSTELEIVKQFERNYSADRSLWWFTRQSFLYRLLNKALRVQNIDLLYRFRFFIRDLAKELRKNKCLSRIRVYRGQQISKEEIEMLKKSIGEYISMNSFLSTSLNRQQARSFLVSGDLSDDVEQVFFEIDADPRLDNIKSFSNITLLSYYPDEEEVLFMIGSVFRIIEMKREGDGVWTIRMVLCAKDDHRLQSLFQHMKKKLGTGETDLLQFGHVLYEMGKLDDAGKYYRRYLDQLSDDHSSLSACYHALGMVAEDKGNFDSSLNWYNKSLQIKIQTLKLDHPNVANNHNSIGEVHRKKGDHTQALESYGKALLIFQKIYGEDHLDVAMCFNNMGLVYGNEMKYIKALKYQQKALIIWKKHLPPDHPHLGGSHNNIGRIRRRLGHYDQALEHYNLSLKIYTKSLPPQHPDIAVTLANIGLVYEDKGDFQQALFYLDKAAKICRHALPPTHSNVITIEQDIKRVSSKLKSFYFP